MPFRILFCALLFITGVSADVDAAPPTNGLGRPILPDAYRASYYGNFDGRWEGTFKPSQTHLPDLDMAAKVYDAEPKFAFEINGDDVKVFSMQRGFWTEIYKGKFHIDSHLTNAVIYTIGDDGKDGVGGWVETWNFTITHKEPDSLYAVGIRMVNNFGRPPDYKDDETGEQGRFGLVFSGDMKRVDSKN